MNVHALYARVSPHFRARRLARFRRVLGPRAGERILDVGGTPWFWRGPAAAGGAEITLLNRRDDPTLAAAAEAAGLRLVAGDGCALPFADQAFDIVCSNSVIEHVGTWARQQAFAAECRRVGRRLWIQTPAREFVIEPHLLAPAIHWLPKRWQRRLIRYGTLRGWLDRPDPAAVDAFLAEVRLLTSRELQLLFPDCTLLRERFLGMPKSYIALRLDS